MQEFINSFGRTNFIIIISVVLVILFALIVTIIIEKLTEKKNNISLEEPLNEKDKLIKENEIEEEQELLEIKQEEPKIEKIDNPDLTSSDEIVYIEDQITEDDAKKQLEEATKKLIEEDEYGLEGPTYFEKEQEESSIISYEELLKKSKNIDEVNDSLLADEGSEPITIEELYKLHLEEKEETFDNPEFEEEISTIVYEEQENKKFKNSEVISPVFGVYDAKIKEVKQEPKEDTEDYLERTIDLSDLENEIKKTEDFLKELKTLKNKLD